MSVEAYAIATGVIPVLLFILAIIIRPKACPRNSHPAA